MPTFDLIIFGATGFTGKNAVEEMVRLGKKYPELSWAVAGRSQSKLESLVIDIEKKTGEKLAVELIVADVGDEPSLKAMCGRTRVLVNCCGPYRLYGEPVVRAAVEVGCHYVDVNGEPQFMESMQLKYGQAASGAGVYVVSACGFDSVPNDLGVRYLQQHFDGTVNSVESYVSARVPDELISEVRRGGLIHYGTWESLVYGVAHRSELAPLRKKLYPEPLPAFKPKLQPRSTLHKHEDKWCIPFAGADASVVYRSQRHLYEVDKKRPAQFKPYIKFPNLSSSLLTIFAGVILFLFTMTSFTIKLLLKYPRLFSLGMVTKEGPTEAVMKATTFTFELYGEGWKRNADMDGKPDKKAFVKVSGVNPGYGATVTALLFSAITILKQGEAMPGTGGVLTPGTAFADTDFIKHLNENNLTFQYTESK